MDFLLRAAQAGWELLSDAALYILFGLLMAAFLKMFLNPAAVVRHLGRGRFLPVLKAALWGVPLPLCSCSVLPAAVSLKRQGANSGATTAFLISTPESGVDSIALSYALLDPFLTIARPLAALVTAVTAGVAENLLGPKEERTIKADLTCPIDECCSGEDCPPPPPPPSLGPRENQRWPALCLF